MFKLESCYLPQIHKAYTNYNPNIESRNIFTNVIRSSYPIRNESNINSWRLFDPQSYHIIDSNNGDIVNIFGASTDFYVHTKNNLLVTSSDAKIKADNTSISLQNNKIFDIAPKEVFTSDLGYGGIKYQFCSLYCQLGYIWYDTDRRKMFRFDNGRLIDVNSAIEEVINRYEFEYCYINIDNASNRVFFCFKNDNDDSLTISLETLTGKYLSIYNFDYTIPAHTNNVVLFGNNQGYVYRYDSNNPAYYAMLTNINGDFPSYIDLQNQTEVCFDIIFNSEYTTPKVLDSITWAHEIIEPHVLDKDCIAQLLSNTDIDNKVNDLKGLKLVIYTDSTDSGLLSLEHSSLNDVANVNNPSGYKYPYYNKGVWNLNYFRNNITEELDDEELNKLSIKYNVNIERLKKLYKVLDKNNNPVYRSSDVRSLIYGKYIVIRFVFNSSEHIKFDNIIYNIKKY